MNLGFLFLEVISTGVITSDELNWITKNLSSFPEAEFFTAIKLGDLLDSGEINIGCRI